MSQSLLKVSSQGVRDFKQKQEDIMNDDLGDVYNEQPAKKAPLLDKTKASVSGIQGAKKKVVKKNVTLKASKGFTTLTKKDLILRNQLETMDEEEQLDYLQNENDNARCMVSDLMESLKGAMKAFKTTQKPAPKADFTKRNESVEETEQKVKKYSKEISLYRRLLANSYNISEIESLEGSIRIKQTELEKVKSENTKIKKWIKQNEKDKQNINENGFYDNEVYKLKNEYRQDKQKIRELYYDNLKRRKGLIERHEAVVRLENGMKRMKDLIKMHKREKMNHSNNTEIVKSERAVTGKVWDVDEMKKKVDSAKGRLKKEQENIDKEAEMQEERIRELEHQVNISSLKLKEKDKELSLAQLKIRELGRNLRHNTLKPLPITPGNLTSRKRKGLVPHKELEGTLVRRNGSKNTFSGKRNSTGGYTRITSTKS